MDIVREWVNLEDTEKPTQSSSTAFNNIVYQFATHRVLWILANRKGRQVYLVEDSVTHERAVVIIAMDSSSDNIPIEVECLRLVNNHPNVCNIYKWCDCGDGRYALLMSAYTYKVPTQEHPVEIRKCLRDILQAIQHTHNVGVCHRDVALQNVMWDAQKSVYVLIDFEGASKHRPEGYTSDIGRDYYDAPEKRHTIMNAGSYHEIAEMYSVGIIFWVLVRGKRKLPTHEHVRAWVKDMQGNSAILHPEIDLLVRLLSHEPMDRISVNDALAHPFFSV
jgi:serine/threonine protein kinase